MIVSALLLDRSASAGPASRRQTPRRRTPPDTRARRGWWFHPAAARDATALPVYCCPDQAGIDDEALVADQTLGHGPRDRSLEQPAQQISVLQKAMAVRRESRVVGHVAIEPQSAELARGKVQMHLVAVQIGCAWSSR